MAEYDNWMTLDNGERINLVTQFPVKSDQELMSLFEQHNASQGGTTKVPPTTGFNPNAPNLNMGYWETMGQGFSRGLEQMGTGFTGKGTESPITGRGLEVPVTNVIEGALKFANAPFEATGQFAGKTLQDLLQKPAQRILGDRPGTEIVAYIAAVADAAAQLGIPYATQTLSKLLEVPLAKMFPYNAEKIATLGTASEAEKAAVAAKANADIQARLALLKQGKTEAQSVADAASQAQMKVAGDLATGATTAETEAQAAIRAAKEAAVGPVERATQNKALFETKFGKPGAEKTLGTATAPTAEQAGAEYAKQVYEPGRAASTAKFQKAYDPLVNDETPIQLTNFQEAAKALPGEAGVMKDAMPLQAERIAENVTAQLAGAPESQVLPSEVRRISQKLEGRRNSLQISEDTYQRVLANLRGGTGSTPLTLGTPSGYKNSAAMFKDVLGPVDNPQTVGDAVEGVLRLRAGQRAAEKAGQGNIARQFGALEEPLLKDIRNASSETADKLAEVSKQYATEHIPAYGPEAIPRTLVENASAGDTQQIVAGIIQPRTSASRVEAINAGLSIIKDPKQLENLTGAFFKGGLDEAATLGKGDVASGLPIWWDRYIDPKTDNHVLKTLLGENRFKSTNEFMQGLKQSATDNFSGIADTAIKNILANRDAQISAIKAAKETKVGTLSEALAAATKARGEAVQGATETIANLSKQTGTEIEQINKATDKMTASIQKEYDAAVLKITGKPPTGNEGHFWGTFQLIHGISATTTGVLLGHAGIGAAYGGVQILTGGLLLMGAPTMIKMIQSARGLNLVNRVIRAVPGTANAIALAAQVRNFSKTLPQQEGTQQP